VFGDPAVTGKSTTGDLRTRKQTPLLVHASTTAEWLEISAHVGRDLTPDELSEIRRLLTVCGSRGFVEDLARTRLTEALTILEELGVSAVVLPVVNACLPILADATEVAA